VFSNALTFNQDGTLIWQDAMTLRVTSFHNILSLLIELIFFCPGFIPSTYVGFTTAAFSSRIWPTVKQDQNPATPGCSTDGL
jgi:hypothetical protein